MTQGPRSLPSSLSAGIDRLPLVVDSCDPQHGRYLRERIRRSRRRPPYCTAGAGPAIRDKIGRKSRRASSYRESSVRTADDRRAARGPAPRNIVGRYEGSWDGARDAELLEPAAEGIGMEAEDPGGAARPVDDPVGLSEDGEDMASLDRFQGGEGRVLGRGGERGGARRRSRSRGSGRSARMTARSRTFSSSRMFPGHR